MCEPTTIAIASMAMTAAAGAATAYGQYQQGQSARAEADYSAGIQRNNAIRAGYLADDAIDRGKADEATQRLRGRLLIGQMRAVLGGSGQVVDEGSAGSMVVDQAETNEMDALTVRNNAEREAWGLKARALNFESEASLTQLAGKNAQRSARWKAAGTLLSTGASVAGKWYSFNKAGMFGGGGGGGGGSRSFGVDTGGGDGPEGAYNYG